MWPVRRTLPCVEQLSLEREIFFLRKLRRGHTNVLNVTDSVALWEAGIVHGAGVPSNISLCN